VVIIIDLSTKLDKLTLPNPTMLASGIMDEDSGSMMRIIESGAGAVVTKSIGLKPRKGHSNPTFVDLEYGILNAMGLPNPGVDEYVEELTSFDKKNNIIIGSIFGSNSAEFIQVAQKMTPFVDAIELNLSCPHAEGYGLEIGQDPSFVSEITTAVKKNVSSPVFVKLSAQVNDISQIAIAAEKAGANAIVAINTLKAMSINLELKRPILGNKTGGYSGTGIKPIGLRAVYELYENVSIPIIGVGGITSGLDAIEYLMAGSTCLQIGTAVYSRGITVFKLICDEIKEWMTSHDIEEISDLIGVAHE
jgi:dihydroorotate dehydrogenase (NAD+) catalytic subunit